MIYEIRAKREINSKLVTVKIIKKLTGMGLRDSKNVVDYLYNNIGKTKTINVDGGIPPEYLDILRNCNISIGDSREDKLNDMLLKYKVNVFSPQMTYKIFEGSVETINGSVIMDIIEGIVIDEDRIIYNEYRKEINNTRLTLDLRNVMIEEPI